MSQLALDACAALHAKQTGSLAVLDCFIEHGMTPVVSQGVYGEAVTMTLSAWLGAHGVEPQRVARQQTNAVRNECDRRRMPGKKDLELLALARERDVPVLTHDGAATDATRRGPTAAAAVSPGGGRASTGLVPAPTRGIEVAGSSMTIEAPKKLIEVALPLDAINVASARESGGREEEETT